MNEKVNIELILDTTKFDAATQNLPDKFKNLASAADIQAFEQNNKNAADAVKETNNQVTQLSTAMKSLSGTISLGNIKAIAKEWNEHAKAIEEAVDNYKALQTRLNETKALFNSLSKEGKASSTTLNLIAAGIADMEKKLNAAGKTVGDVAKKFNIFDKANADVKTLQTSLENLKKTDASTSTTGSATSDDKDAKSGGATDATVLALKKRKEAMEEEQKASEKMNKAEIDAAIITGQVLTDTDKQTQNAKKEFAKDEAKTEDDIQKQKEKNNKDALTKLRTEATKAAQEISDAIFAIEKANRDASLAADIKKLEDQKTKELSNVSLTADQKAAISATYAKKEAEQKLHAWQADKKAKLESASINTALAIINALATSPWPVNIVMAAAAAVTGATQIATIASSKPPQFAKGTKNAPAGMAWVGEEGPELTYLPGGTKVITHPESVKIMEKYSIPSVTGLTGTDVAHAQPRFANTIDYNKLGDVLAEKLRNNPQTHLSLDKNGFSLHLINQQKRVERLNNRYRSG